MSRHHMLFPNFTEKAVTLSYDDGIRADKKLISIMKSNKLKGTFNLNSGLFVKENSGNDRERITRDEALEFYTDSMMEVAVHGYKHELWGGIDLPSAIKDIVEDKIHLERLFSTPTYGVAYPYGSYNDDVIDFIKKIGFKYSRIVESNGKFELPKDWFKWAPTCHHSDPKLMDLAKEFIELKLSGWRYAPAIFYLWGHSYEFVDANNWYKIENFAKYIGNREDVWYATNWEICEYVTAFDSLVLSINSDFVYNPTSIDVYIKYGGNKYIVHCREKILIK